MPANPRWYSVSLTFVSRVGAVESLRPLCEERIVLFQASSEAEARALALKYGREAEHSYANPRGEVVEWRLAGVEAARELEPPLGNRGWEVGSRFVRRQRRRLPKRM